MADRLNTPATAFAGARQIAGGRLLDVALAVKTAGESGEADILVLDDTTGRVIDIDLRGDAAAIAARLSPPEEPARRGRPKLGVVAREVTLLPRHWEWLGRQKGGASATLRRLIDDARRTTGRADETRATQETVYNAMTVLAGDRPRYEDAVRALYAADLPAFNALVSAWPDDVAAYIARLAAPLAADPETGPGVSGQNTKA